ncbi:MAG TPA: hypothetical protein VN231_03800 [Allosphingosinicella sp.]|nr:hypothetical protein [Allosphingosinicella sp.]
MSALRWLAGLCLLALAGCWTGGPFYQPSDARAAIPPGDYRAEGREPRSARVSILADGLTRIVHTGEATGVGDDVTLGLVPLPGRDGAFVGWVTRLDGHDLTGHDTLYLLVWRDSDGGFELTIPACSRDSGIAREAGAAVENHGGLVVCRFADRLALEEAMRRYPRRDDETVRFLPVQAD